MNLTDNCSHVLGDSCGPSGSVSGDESYFNVVLFNPVGVSGDVSKNGPDSPLETCDMLRMGFGIFNFSDTKRMTRVT